MKKKLAIIILAIFGVLAIAFGVFLIINAVQGENPYGKMAEAEVLISIKKWQKEDESTVIWEFGEGTGKITTNADEYFDMEWGMKDGVLSIKTKWLTDLRDDFEIKVDKDAPSFTVISKTDSKESKFVPYEEKEETETTPDVVFPGEEIPVAE